MDEPICALFQILTPTLRKQEIHTKIQKHKQFNQYIGFSFNHSLLKTETEKKKFRP